MAEKKQTDWDDVPEVRKGFASFKFENIGDTFIGKYLGEQEITNDEGEIIEAFVFEDQDGVPTGIWKAYDLTRKMEEIPEGSEVRIEYRTDIETKRGLSPMKEFSVKYKY